MLRTRLWMGALLVALVVGVLVVDPWLHPWYPILLCTMLGFSLRACWELLHLLGEARRPRSWLCYTAVAALMVANWPGPLIRAGALPLTLDGDPWHWILGVFTGLVLAAFLVEMARFREPGESVPRIALTVWIASYIGLLPSFLIQLRWFPDGGPGETRQGSVALALAILVPKCGDIGAYFTGRLIGRQPMAPLLSPKKTWEGAVGGITAAVLAAIGINALGQVLRGGLRTVIVFGLAVGVAGLLGDLAESLIKRDCKQKDASHAVPGFGGVLDVVDAVIFAAPVAYWWLR